jgi:hypothetical protein
MVSTSGKVVPKVQGTPLAGTVHNRPPCTVVFRCFRTRAIVLSDQSKYGGDREDRLTDTGVEEEGARTRAFFRAGEHEKPSHSAGSSRRVQGRKDAVEIEIFMHTK